jgi:hypothetical protein
MLRLRPTVISLTMGEVRDYEASRLHRQGSRAQEGLLTLESGTEKRNHRHQKDDGMYVPRIQSGISDSFEFTTSQCLNKKEFPDISVDEDLGNNLVAQVPSNIPLVGNAESRAGPSVQSIEQLVTGQPLPSPSMGWLAMTPSRFPSLSRVFRRGPQECNNLTTRRLRRSTSADELTRQEVRIQDLADHARGLEPWGSTVRTLDSTAGSAEHADIRHDTWSSESRSSASQETRLVCWHPFHTLSFQDIALGG